MARLIRVFEYEELYIDEVYNNVKFEICHFTALSKLNKVHNDKYLNIRHNGVKFKQYVGVIQVDELIIEILPKIDRFEPDESKNKWHKVLIEMLKATRKLKIQQVGQANVSRQSIHLLDIYFDWFLDEVQLLIHKGLIKQYYKQTGNVKALKGKLEFAGHIQRNFVHKERFYTTHQVYEKDHLIHQILNQALDIIALFSKGNYIYSKCKTVQLNFPDVKSIKVNESTFSKVPKSRKTVPYETALSIARLIILNFAPDVSSGSEKMLALLFDMNRLWEEYVLVKLKQAAEGSNIEVYGQNSTGFWDGITIRPDIVLKKENGEILIVDTKWKNIEYSKPSIHDLRQMYVYNEFWKSNKSLLLYPSQSTHLQQDLFIDFDDMKHGCSLGRITVIDAKGNLDKNIALPILNLFTNQSYGQ